MAFLTTKTQGSVLDSENTEKKNKSKKEKVEDEENGEEGEKKEKQKDSPLARRLINPLTDKAGKKYNELSDFLQDKNASKLFLNILYPLNKNYLNAKDIAFLTTQKPLEQKQGKKPSGKQAKNEKEENNEEETESLSKKASGS